MKKVRMVPVLAFMLLAITQSASAQLRLGLVGGFNSSNLKPADRPVATPLPTGGNAQGDFNSRAAVAIGGVAEYHFSPAVGLSVQPMYSQQGGKLVFDVPVPTPLNSESTTKLGYVDIPVMLKVQLGSSTVRPYLTTGFTLGFLTSAKYVAAGEEMNLKDDIKSTNSSWNIGGGLNVPAAGKTVFLEGRYSWGLTDINDGPQIQALSASTELKTTGVQFLVGVTFPVGR